MASTAQVNRPVADPNTNIVVKVTRDGVTQKIKMPLKDMVHPVLEYQLRNFLVISPTETFALERYSDSTGAYVRLEPPPSTTYKQLYRAAKAKAKLKLRVVSDNVNEAEQAPAPAPAPAPSTAPLMHPANDLFSAMSQLGTLDWTKRLEGLEQTLGDQFADLEETFRKHGITTTSSPLRGSSNPAPTPASPAETAAASNKTTPTGQTPDFHSYVPKQPIADTPLTLCPGMLGHYTVCCNSCEKMVADMHYHCSTCDDGDFDLCPTCIDQGVTCHSPSHWMTKRTVVNGQFVDSVTRTAPMKKKDEPKATNKERQEMVMPAWSEPISQMVLRTCNCCLIELAEKEFIHCQACEDFDLCQTCFVKDSHGHHPKHAFAPAVEGVQLSQAVSVRLAAGRNQSHNAICDGCDKFINGVRHKCLDCPDFDFCSTCAPEASSKHPRHRFAPIYDALPDDLRTNSFITHSGICCDGPLCVSANSFIRGVRYKCAVCHDTDFCANCEASPHNKHNKTHPLIMVKTPLRHVSVTTTGEKPSGQAMPILGDKEAQRQPSFVGPERPATLFSKMPSPRVGAVKVEVQSSGACPRALPIRVNKPAEPVQPTIIPAQPKTEPVKVDEKPKVQEKAEATDFGKIEATFVNDTVADGTIMPQNHHFEQTWTLRNTGTQAWPQGSAVKFVGGDYMGRVDSDRPAEVTQLNMAAESTPCERDVQPGQMESFKIHLRTPHRAGKFVSYWRLTAPNGTKFGDRLWCDVKVRAVQTEEKVIKKEPEIEEPKAVAKKAAVEDAPEEEEASQASSRMIFPKLEKESPETSVYEAAPAPSSVPDDKSTVATVEDESVGDEDWDEGSFLTDDEYDILDASDEDIPEDLQTRGRHG